MDRPHTVAELLELVVLSIPVKWLSRLPCSTENADVFLLTLVARRFVEEVTFFGLLSVTSSSDKVNNRTTFAELVESGKCLCRYRWIERVWTQSYDDFELLGVGCDCGTGGERVKASGVVLHEVSQCP